MGSESHKVKMLHPSGKGGEWLGTPCPWLGTFHGDKELSRATLGVLEPICAKEPVWNEAGIGILDPHKAPVPVTVTAPAVVASQDPRCPHL